MDIATRRDDNDSSGITVKELLRSLWRARWLVLAIVALPTCALVVAALLLPKYYSASVVFSPVSSNGAAGQLGGLSPLISQFGGLASLAGFSLNSDAKKSESLAVLQSEALTEQYLKRNNLLPILYSPLWDRRTQRWKVTAPKAVPTLWKANRYFRQNVRSVSIDIKTGIVTMTITWTDPRLAAEWANGLLKMTNDYLRDQAIAESERNIAYLNREAAKTDVVGVKQAIYSILQNEISKEMLARGSDEYALKVLDPAIPPETPSSPKPLMWALVGIFAGSLASLFLVLVRITWLKS